MAIENLFSLVDKTNRKEPYLICFHLLSSYISFSWHKSAHNLENIWVGKQTWLLDVRSIGKMVWQARIGLSFYGAVWTWVWETDLAIQPSPFTVVQQNSSGSCWHGIFPARHTVTKGLSPLFKVGFLLIQHSCLFNQNLMKGTTLSWKGAWKM